MFGNSGRAFVGHDGVWQVKLTGDVAAVEFRLKDGKKIPFTRTKKGSYLEKSEFTLSPAGIEALDSAAGSERISVFYSKDGSKWSDYKSYKSQAGQISLEQLRAAIKWATAPFSREYEKQ